LSKRITVIGGGPAGYVAAIRAAQLGAEATVIEPVALGGVCTNVGCIPTKTYYHFAEILHDIEKAQKEGVISGEFATDWRRMMVKKDRIVARLVKGIEYLLKKNEVRFLSGTGRIIEPGKVEVAGADGKTQTVESDYILIATGSEPMDLPIDGWEGANVWTNTELLGTERMPESLLIIGGGIIGCEFAHILASFGCKATIVEIMETILPGMDPDVIEAVTKALAKEGVSIRTGAAVKNIERTSDGIIAKTDDEIFEAEEILGAVGRRPTPPEGSDKLLNLLKNGAVAVDNFMSAGEQIWAAGDVTGAPYLAHRASAMGEAAIENMLGAKNELNNNAIPGAFFTALEVGTVGLTETDAKNRFGSVSVGKFPYRASGRAHTASSPDGFVKVIAVPEGHIVGIHIAGKEASEMLSAAALTVARRLSIDDWRETVVAHPTFGEMLRESALDTEDNAIHI